MTDEKEQNDQCAVPEISRFAFAMFDVLGFAHWVETEQETGSDLDISVVVARL